MKGDCVTRFLPLAFIQQKTSLAHWFTRKSPFQYGLEFGALQDLVPLTVPWRLIYPLVNPEDSLACMFSLSDNLINHHFDFDTFCHLYVSPLFFIQADYKLYQLSYKHLYTLRYLDCDNLSLGDILLFVQLVHRFYFQSDCKVDQLSHKLYVHSIVTKFPFCLRVTIHHIVKKFWDTIRVNKVFQCVQCLGAFQLKILNVCIEYKILTETHNIWRCRVSFYILQHMHHVHF
jgi:hypothetical protein